MTKGGRSNTSSSVKGSSTTSTTGKVDKNQGTETSSKSMEPIIPKGKKRNRPEAVSGSGDAAQNKADNVGPVFKVPEKKSNSKASKQSVEATQLPSGAKVADKSQKRQRRAPSSTGSDLEESSSDLSFSEDPSTGSEVDMDSSSVDEIAGGTAVVDFELDTTTKQQLDEKLRQAPRKSAVDPSKGVIYLSHLPFGFFEPQLRGFFAQFGTVSRVRLSRSKRSGRSKGYAWVEFDEPEVAKIAAETMNNYLMSGYGRRILCEYIPSEKLHPQVFKGADRKFKAIPWRDINRSRHNKAVTEADYLRHVERLVKGDEKKRKKLAEMGLDYDMPASAVPDPSILPSIAADNKAVENETEPPKAKRAKKN